jgi:hypothetical protein
MCFCVDLSMVAFAMVAFAMADNVRNWIALALMQLLNGRY